jgi:DNA repair protein RecO (recombination protein O)
MDWPSGAGRIREPQVAAVEWTDEAIVLGTRRHGEASVILEAMTRAHGRHLGLVRSGSGSRLRAVLQPGNTVRVNWRARLDEHLGHYMVEGLRLRAEFLGDSCAVYGVTHLAALCRLLPERDPHAIVCEALESILEQMDASAAMRVVQFEMLLLAELGFGLELDACAATGARVDLVYVSPKSGRAVSAQAGAPWRDKLLRLPPFLSGAEAMAPSAQELADGFELTGYFLANRVFGPRGLAASEARAGFIAAVLRTHAVAI